MFLFGAAKKAAEVAGLVDAPEPEIEDQVEVDQDVQPVHLVQTIDIKQIGNVAPFVSIKDPAKDLAILEELYGVYRESEKVMVMSCEDCEAEYTIPYQEGVSLDEDCECPDCGYEGDVSDFLKQIDTKTSTSRTPSVDELLFVAGHRPVPSYYSDRDRQAVFDKVNTMVVDYYASLLGHGGALSDEEAARGVRFDGMDSDGVYKVSCGGCQDEDDNCQCNAQRMQYFGKLRPLSEMVNDDDGEE